MGNTVNISTIEFINRYPALECCSSDIKAACSMIIKALECDQTLFVCGNGGSASDAEHIAGELIKNFAIERPLNDDLQIKLKNMYGDTGTYIAGKLQKGLRVIALTGHYALSTAMANDIAADLIFAQQLNAFGKSGDVLLGISTSGNSVNVCHAARLARVLGIESITLTGQSGGELATLSDVSVKVPENETYKIQEFHLPIYHFICMTVENYFFLK